MHYSKKWPPWNEKLLSQIINYLLTCTNKSLLQIVSLRHLNVRTKNGLDFAAQVSTRKSSVFASKRLKCQKKHLAISQVKTPFEKFITISLNSSDIQWKHCRILKQQLTILLFLNSLFSTQSAGRDTYGDVSSPPPPEKGSSWRKSTRKVRQRVKFKNIFVISTVTNLTSKDKGTDQSLFASKSPKSSEI